MKRETSSRMDANELDPVLKAQFEKWMDERMERARREAAVNNQVAHQPAAEVQQPAGDLRSADLLEEFSGRDGVLAEEWVRRLELAMQIGGWSEAQTRLILMSKLSGSARLWHLNHGAQLERYDEWKPRFLAAHTHKQKVGVLIDKLQRCVQQRGETIGEYARRKEGIALQLGMSNDDIKDQVLRGLLPEYSFLVLEMSGRHHEDLSALVSDIEDVMSLHQHVAKVGRNVGDASTFRDARQPSGESGTRCYSCGRAGHQSAQCRQHQYRAISVSLPQRQPRMSHHYQQRPLRPEQQLRSQHQQQQGPQHQHQRPHQQQHRQVQPEVSESQQPGSSHSGWKPPLSSMGSAQGKTASVCFRCQLPGHFARDCTREVSRLSAPKTVIGQENSKKNTKSITVNGVDCLAKIDTGAEVTVIARRMADQLRLRIEPTTINRVHGVGGASVPLGQCVVDLVIDGVLQRNVILIVLEDSAFPSETILLGEDLLSRGNLLTVYCRGTAKLLRADAYPDIANLFPENKSKVKLVAQGSVTLPPRTVSLVEVEPSATEEKLLLIEDKDAQCGVLCEAGKSPLVLPVANYSAKEVRLAKGAVVKRANCVTDIYEPQLMPTDNKGSYVMQLGCTDDIRREDITMDQGAPEEVRIKLYQLLKKYRSVIATSMKDLGQTSLAEFEIVETPGSQPVSSKPFRLSLVEREALRDIIGQMKQAGMITHSDSAYASPVLMVRKKSGDWRMVIDYRKLNAQTVRMNFPLPHIDDILDAVSGKKWYTVLDLAWGYFQIPMATGSAEKAAFVTPDGHYQPEVMMMGLANAPAKFQQVMTKIRDMIGHAIAFPFMDDLITASDDYDEHLEQIERILQVLQEAKLTVRLNKCGFFMKRVEFLGFRVSRAGVQPGRRKLIAIADFPHPKTTMDVRRFLGLASFFRRFVKGFAEIASPLSSLLKKNVRFEWTDTCQAAFDKIKQILLKEPVLMTFTPGKPTELHTDASMNGLGAILLQCHNAKWKLVYAISRKLSATECKYHSTKLEQLAVVWAMQRLRHYLHGQHVTVVTDCRAVEALKSKTASAQVARWLNQLADFDFSIKHRPGSKMEHVDALSRAPVETEEESSESDEPNEPECVKYAYALTLEEEIAMIQAKDTDIIRIITALKKDKQERTGEERSLTDGFLLLGGLLYKKEDVEGVIKKLFVVPKSVRKYICVMCHDRAGHFGADKTLTIIRERYWFPRMRSYVKNHVRACIECLFNKDYSGRREGLCNPTMPTRRPFQKVFLDFLGPLPKSAGKEHIIVAVDNFSKYVLLEAVKSATTASTITFLERTFLRFGTPDVLITDRGTAFTSNAFKEFITKHGVRHVLISTQHPQSNGQVERINKEVARMLRTCSRDPDKKDWCHRLATVESQMNMCPSKSTGKAPFEILHGYLPRRDNFSIALDAVQDTVWKPAGEVQDSIRHAVERAQDEYTQQYNKKRFPHRIRYVVGDVVVVRRLPLVTGEPTKLQAKFKGPMVVTEVLPHDTYRISELLGQKGYTTTAHCSQLRLYKLAVEDGDDVEGGSNSETEEAGDTRSSNSSRADRSYTAAPPTTAAPVQSRSVVGAEGGTATYTKCGRDGIGGAATATTTMEESAADGDGDGEGQTTRRSSRERRPPNRYGM